MKKTATSRRASSFWALAAAIVAFMALNIVGASAQCCDLVIDVDEDVNCCLTVNGSEWSDMGRPDTDGPYCAGGGTIVHVPCPTILRWVSIQTQFGPVTIFNGSSQHVLLKTGCCVLITLDQTWPAAPCYYLHVQAAPLGACES